MAGHGRAMQGTARRGKAWQGKAGKGPQSGKPACGISGIIPTQGKGFMKTFMVQIEGVSSLLQNRFSETQQADSPTRANTAKERPLPRDQATKAAYLHDDGRCYMPGAAFARLLREAGGGHKVTGTRKSVKYVVPSATLILDDSVDICKLDGTVYKDFEVDSRPVVIPSTKGRVMRHRPRWDSWRVKFSVQVDEDVLSPKLVHQLIEEGGRKIGVGDFRPEKGGPFGRFAVVSWDEVK